MTEAANNFLLKLRRHTAPYHKSIEQLPLSSLLMSKEVSLQHYKDYLIILYGFTKTFERYFYPKLEHEIPDLENRRKTEFLFDDLQSLHVQPEQIQTIDEKIFDVNYNEATILSAMYVMEGSTLGGQIISQHLEKMLGQSVAGSLKYLQAYNTKTGSMWKAFLNIFCEITITPSQQNEAVEGAIKTFMLLEKWMVEQSKIKRTLEKSGIIYNNGEK